VPQAAKNKEPGLGGRVLALVSTKQSIAMSALGHKRTFRVARAMSALPPRADIGAAQIDFC